MSLAEARPGAAALVTGASSGIGEAIARELGSRGYATILVARRQHRLRALADELAQTFGRPSHALVCDLEVPAERATLITEVEALGLDVDILVNSAGFATGGPFVAADTERELAQVRLMVEALVALTAAFLPGMVARGRGGVLNVSSTAGIEPLPYAAGYSAVKHHTLAFSQALHHEVRRAGVAVTALCPGPVSTELWEIAGDHPLEQVVPKPLWITPTECARQAIAALAANRRVALPSAPLRASYLGMRPLPAGLKLRVTERLLRPRRPVRN